MRTRTWALLGLSAVALGLAGLDLRPSRPASAPRVESSGVRSGPMIAGAGRARVELPEGALLAGYRPFGRAGSGPPSPTHVRALLLEVPGVRVAIVLTELLTVPHGLARAVEALGRAEGAGCTVVVASHTHSGPGGYDEEALPQAVAIGRHDPRVVEALVAASQDALAAASADLGTALPFTGEIEGGALVRNRDRPGAPVDDRLTVVALDRPDGTPVARMVRLAAHPTLAGRDAGLGGDWPSRVMDGLEEQGGVALVLQGAVGDASAAVEGDDRVGSFAAAVLDRVRAAPLAGVGPPVALGCARAAIDLPPPQAGSAVPAPLRRLAGNALSLVAPPSASVTVLRLDDLLLAFEPAEATAAAQLELQREVAGAGLRARTVSLAQGYLGYAPTAEAFAGDAYSARFAWFGPALAERFALGAAAGARALSLPAAATAPRSPSSPSDAPAPAAARPRP